MVQRPSTPGSNARPPNRYGLRRQVLERLGELFELVLVARTRSRRGPRATRAVKPVSRSIASRTRAASAGSTARLAARLRFAPASCAARSAARDREALLDDPLREPRRPSWSGTASTARAWPSVSSPRATIQSTSSGRSSSRTRFETSASRLPTRSATSPSERSNSSMQQRVARASSTGDSCSRATFSTSASSSVSRSSASRTSAGSVGEARLRAARQRRSPAISS